MAARTSKYCTILTRNPSGFIDQPGMSTRLSIGNAGIPGLSGISFQAGSSGLYSNDCSRDDGVDFNVKVRGSAIYGNEHPC